MLTELKKDILKYYTRAYADGFMAGTSGNASMFSPEENAIVITPSGVDYRELDENALLVISPDGQVLEGHLKPSSEWKLHAEVYKAVPKARAILHTHSPHATAFAVVGKPIPEILIEMQVFLDGPVPVAPFAPAGSLEVAKLTAETLTTAPACLMQNHGAAAWAETMEMAYLRASYVEDAAKIYCLANNLGTPRTIHEL